MEKDQLEKMASVFKEMKISPQFDSAETFKQWMFDYVASSGARPKMEPAQEPNAGASSSHTKEHIITQPPRLPFFSGDPTSKAEIPYELWKYDVECLLRDASISREVVLRVIRSSLRGNAGMIAMRLGPQASINDLLTHLETNYGIAEDQEALLAKFFSAHQEEGEDVASWSCRLEDILMKVSRCEMLPREKRNQMLHSRVWKGLQSPLKERSATKYELIKDYNELKVELRRLESELKVEKAMSSSTKTATTKMISGTTSEESRLDKLEGMVKQLTSEVKSWNSTQRNPNKYKYQPPQKNKTSEHESRGESKGDERSEPQCWRCGQYGHLQLGCKVRLDHQRRGQYPNRSRHLNGKAPMGRGRP
ncbi:uncharacterized protein [Argopecten irradians]|uniref:uncharacterized protein n=1 Tax=Argopecten irradians TaxID=31199 RepID=UPI0037124E50